MMDMKGIVWILLLVWTICHATTSGGIDDSRILGAPPATSYPIVRFRADNPYDDSSYGEMITRLRGLLTRHGGFRQGIPVLASSVSDSERYILLEMIVDDESGAPQTVTFAINVVNVYIVGYLDGSTDTRHFFQEGQDFDPNIRQLLFTGARATSPWNISSNYQHLESPQAANRSRLRINLGLRPLENAIRNLLGGQGGRQQQARALIVVLQMVAEAARYWEIERAVRQADSTPPSPRIIGLENSWSSLSLEIQRSDGFAFQQPVRLVDEVADNMLSFAVKALFLMLYRCPPPRLVGHDLLPLNQTIICPTTQLSLLQPYYGMQQQVMRSDLEAEVEVVVAGVQDECTVSSNPPRARIIGRDGLCVEVENFKYSDNNPVVLSTCKTSDVRNQLWTWRRSDGRIISLEKCLTASGNKAGSSVVIRECDPLEFGSPSRWRMSYHGTLVHVYSKLVLTATSGEISSRLTVEKPTSSSFQAWQSTNVTAGAAGTNVMIVGENNRCIYYDGGSGVYTEPCSSGATSQRWRLYPDGTIRPIDWLDGCLELKSMARNDYNYIQAGSCASYPEYHRWIFTHTGAIQNMASGLVVDEDKNSEGYLQAASYSQGAGNQIWRTRLVN